MIITHSTTPNRSPFPVMPLAEIAYGPCEGAALVGPAAERGSSFACSGWGLEDIDPARMGDLGTCFSTAILCGHCKSAREALADLETWQ